MVDLFNAAAGSSNFGISISFGGG